MHLHSPAFFIGGTIPFKYTCDGENLSPPLHWDEAPHGTNSFALIVEDPDAPTKTFTHWVLYNLPGDRRELPPRSCKSTHTARWWYAGQKRF